MTAGENIFIKEDNLIPLDSLFDITKMKLLSWMNFLITFCLMLLVFFLGPFIDSSQIKSNSKIIY